MPTGCPGSLDRRRPACTVEGGIIFMFGGYDGHHYHADLQVYFERPVVEMIFGLPRLDQLEEQFRLAPRGTSSSILKIRHSSGVVGYPKYWMAVRFKNKRHRFVGMIEDQHTLDLSSFSLQDVESAFSSHMQGTWPIQERPLEILKLLGISQNDIIHEQSISLLLESMKSLERFGSCCISLGGDRGQLYLDGGWLAQFSGFFREFTTFSPSCEDQKAVQSMNQSFLCLLKVLLIQRFALDYKALKLEEVLDAFECADYLVCPLIQKVELVKAAVHQTLRRPFREGWPAGCGALREDSEPLGLGCLLHFLFVSR